MPEALNVLYRTNVVLFLGKLLFFFKKSSTNCKE
jgi:hypothetical protein